MASWYLGHGEILEILALIASLPAGPHISTDDIKPAKVATWTPGEDLAAFLTAPRELPYPGGAVWWSVGVVDARDRSGSVFANSNASIGDVAGFMARFDEIVRRQIKYAREVHDRETTPGDYRLRDVILFNAAPPGHFLRAYPMPDDAPPALVAHADGYSLGVDDDAFAHRAGRIYAAISRDCALVNKNYTYCTTRAFRVLVAASGEPTRYARFAVGGSLLDELPLGRAVDVLLGHDDSIVVVTVSHAVRLTPIDDATWGVESRRHYLYPTAAYRVGDCILLFHTFGGPFGEFALYDFATGEVVSKCDNVYAPGRPSLVGGVVYVPNSYEGFQMVPVIRIDGRRITELDHDEPRLPSPAPRLVDVDGAIGYQDGERIVLTAPGRTFAHLVPSHSPSDHYKLAYSDGWYAGGVDGAIRIWPAKNADE